MNGLLRILTLLAVFSVVTFADDKEDQEYVLKMRAMMGAYGFTTPDYPAAFAIVAGVSIVLVVAVIFIVVGMLSSDPGKDSIIYRMTMTRMKKD